MIKQITKSEAIAVLDAFHNNIITVTFIKKNGELRNLTGRQGVKKYLVDKTKESNRAKPNKGQFTIFWDFFNRGYRMFDLERLMSIRVSGDVYIIR